MPLTQEVLPQAEVRQAIARQRAQGLTCARRRSAASFQCTHPQASPR